MRPYPGDVLIFSNFFTSVEKEENRLKVARKIFALGQKYFFSTFSERGGRDESKNAKKFEIGSQMRRVEAKTCFYPFLGKFTLPHVGNFHEGALAPVSRLFIPAMGPKWKLFTP